MLSTNRQLLQPDQRAAPVLLSQSSLDSRISFHTVGLEVPWLQQQVTQDGPVEIEPGNPTFVSKISARKAGFSLEYGCVSKTCSMRCSRRVDCREGSA